MPRIIVVFIALTASIACLAAPTGAQVRKVGANLVEVTVTGSGLSRDEAISDAKRRAVEKGAGSYIYSQSKTSNSGFAVAKGGSSG